MCRRCGTTNGADSCSSLHDPPRDTAHIRDEAVEIIRFVKRTQEHGFSLEEINELLHLYGGGPDDCDAARRLAQKKIAELDEKIRDLQCMRASLTEFASTCALPRADRHCPMLQTLHIEWELRHLVIEDSQSAALAGMAGSPTLLVDGHDPLAESNQIPSVSCRLYRDAAGAVDGAPTVSALRRAFGMD
jgi:DNA-binding transcriptional MerR regulator